MKKSLLLILALALLLLAGSAWAAAPETVIPASEPTATPMPMPTRKFVLVIVYTSEIYYGHFCFATAL